MVREEMENPEIPEEVEYLENSYKTLHKLIKSGMWKMYCNRDFQIERVEWSDDLRHMIGDERDKLERERDEAFKKANSALTAMNVLHEAMKSGAWSNTYDLENHSQKVEWSNAFRALLGFENEEDFPNEISSFMDRVYPKDIEKLKSDYTKAVYDESGKIVYDTEFRAKVKHGEYWWFRTTGRMTREEGADSCTFYGMLMDIHDKKMTDALYGEIRWRIL